MKIKLPDTIVLLLIILVFSCVLTWIVPSGEFDRIERDGRELVVSGSYHVVSPNPVGFFQLIMAPIRGFSGSAEIIAFIFFVAGAFGIINRSGAISAGLRRLVDGYNTNRKKRWIIPVLTLFFSMAGATFGMSEEVLVFILLTLPLSFSLGYDSFMGVAIPFLGAGAGFAGAFINPFTVGIAQGIAELAPFSGWEYRVIVWFIFTSVTIAFLMRYAARLEKDPKISLNYQEDQKSKHRHIETDQEEFNGAHRWVLITLALGLAFLIVGVNRWDWYITEISALFLVMGMISALIARVDMQEAIDAFMAGAAEMIKVCFVIGIARGIIIVASEGTIIDTMLYYTSTAVEGYPNTLSIQLMFYVQTFLNFFLPSGSGQAALTMPIMAPLSDIIGVSRQTAVLAFQLGDGLSNMVIPTSGVTMGVLTLSNISYKKWLQWIWPLMLIYFVLAMILLIPPTLVFNW
ncbi:YfcC family protein [Reichenbachiella ulvae]|uniref:TIGR00366 family protein n=1 Tax=Reichenbachiella ulvae TaxID=2980104 RepID=A0ABT3CNT5_9BACT|nr:TIGR00366 family protein [Reichenbachiella ulvae]MCV9385302.1 TIGR00366 family protein [Reichenbachiella ulvae]